MRKIGLTAVAVLFLGQSILYSEAAGTPIDAGGNLAETADAPSVTLAACREAALSRNPLAGERAIIDRTLDLSVALATRELYPKVSLTAKATTQSDSMDISIPPLGLSINQDPEQYQVAAEISQTIYDGGLSSAKKKGSRALSLVDGRKLAVDLDSLVSRVDSLFFGVIFADAQLAQNALLVEDLSVNRARVKAMVDAGNASKSDLSSVEVEILKARQARAELESTRAALVGCLSILSGDIVKDSPFETPARPNDLAGGVEARGEFALFAAQEGLAESAKSASVAQAMPRLFAFAQVGYGMPALNMLSGDPDSFWLVGLRANWAIDSFYSLPLNLEKADRQAELSRLRRDAYALAAEQDAVKARSDVAKYARLVAGDDEIIALRASIRRSAESKYENGTISVSDLLREIAAEHLALQTKRLHEIQLLGAEYSLETALGKRGK
jgi:outer membrane protein TolC